VAPSRVGILTLLAATWTAGTSRAQELRIYDIDVEQAAATLIVSPGGHTLLVDSGKNGHGPRILAALQTAGATRIDHFVATHYHEDHYGGIDEVVRAGVPVGTAYDRGDKAFLPPSTSNNGTFKDYQQALGHRAEHLTRGQTIPLDPSMSVLCISSGGVVLGEPAPAQHGNDENDMSLGLLITYGSFRLWVGGDVETATESKIAALDLVRDIDVYQANHHGADNGSSTEFLADMKPTVVIISNGDHGGFRHPRASTLARIGALVPAPAIFQTNRYLHSGDDGGNVPSAFIADPETVDTDGTILVTVKAAADSYTVSFGATRRAFALKTAGTPGQAQIVRVLPDPTDGPDRQREAVTIRNGGATPVNLTNWLLRDLAGSVWPLSGQGTLGPGQEKTIRRSGMPMSLDNDGDTVELLDPTGKLADALTYLHTQPGVEIEHSHFE
jgi:beta-lactamase superfamily II metal-dependent hydrolase